MSMRRSANSLRHVPLFSIAVLGAVFVACSAAPVSTTPSAPPESSVPDDANVRADDGILRIGILLPASGEGAAIGQSARAAVRVAVAQANANGGVHNRPVEIVIRDEGSDAASAAASLQELVDSQVDVIVGPASSNVAISLASTIASSGIAACSPSASTIALDNIPSRSMLFRTIASDSLQAEAMAEAIEQTGSKSAAITFVDDGYGRPFAQALQLALGRRSIKVSDFAGFAVDDDEFGPEAKALVASQPGAIALIGDADAGSRMLVALAQATDGKPRDIVVNDALRRPMSIGVLGAIAPAVLAKLVGVSQNVVTANDAGASGKLVADIAELTNESATGLFATQAYDCANLFMLAAIQSDSTRADLIADEVGAVSVGGQLCLSFIACANLLADGRNIDYDGPSGQLQLGVNGDPSTAVFEEFTFDSGGRDIKRMPITVVAGGG